MTSQPGPRPSPPESSQPEADAAGRVARRRVLLRLDPAVHDALIRWAGDELRSVNAQIDLLVRRALAEAGRMPRDAAPTPRRGRPPRAARRDPPESVD